MMCDNCGRATRKSDSKEIGVDVHEWDDEVLWNECDHLAARLGKTRRETDSPVVAADILLAKMAPGAIADSRGDFDNSKVYDLLDDSLGHLKDAISNTEDESVLLKLEEMRIALEDLLGERQ